MDKRAKFLWNILIGIASIAFTFYSYKLYNLNGNKNEMWNSYISSEVGTDEKLQKKVIELENNYKKRNYFKFKMKKNPIDLSNVITFEGISNLGNTFRKLSLLQIGKLNNNPMATVKYKNNYYNVVMGDTIGGGTITVLTKTKMVYEKDDEEYTFSVKPKITQLDGKNN